MKRLAIILSVFLCAPSLWATTVFDNFQRPDSSSLGGSWGTVYGDHSGSFVIKSHAYANSTSGGGNIVSVWQGSSFGNDQWAQATISAIAPSTSVVAITAASQSGSNTTYTYTLTTGAALVVNQEIYITGMGHAGNNSGAGGFYVTSLGSGTFTVVNASGVTATENGTGTSPSDSNVGLVVRGSSNGQNGYLMYAGTNSGCVGAGGCPGSDSRVYDIELWKVQSGTFTFLAQARNVTAQPWTTTPDSANDVYVLAVTGTLIQVWKNNLPQIYFTDSSISSGSPGIAAWSVGGTGEWGSPTTYGTGNNGTQWTSWIGSDGTLPTFVPDLSDLFPYSNGDLHTANANWVYEDSGTFQVSSNIVYSSKAGVNLTYRSDQVWPNDQWVIVKAQVTGGQSTQNGGPALRISTSAQTAYFLQYATDLVMRISKDVAGTITALTIGTIGIQTGDIVIFQVNGNVLTATAFHGGTRSTFISATDSAISSGNAGIMDAGNATVNGDQTWQAGGFGTDPTPPTAAGGQAGAFNPGP